MADINGLMDTEEAVTIAVRQADEVTAMLPDIADEQTATHTWYEAFATELARQDHVIVPTDDLQSLVSAAATIPISDHNPLREVVARWQK